MRQKIQTIKDPFLAFLKSEASGGVILLICAITAIILVKSRFVCKLIFPSEYK